MAVADDDLYKPFKRNPRLLTILSDHSGQATGTKSKLKKIFLMYSRHRDGSPHIPHHDPRIESARKSMVAQGCRF